MTPDRRRIRLRVSLALAVAATVGAACTVSAAAPESTPVGTVGDVGRLPGTFTPSSTDAAAVVIVTDTEVAGTEPDPTELEVDTTEVPPSIPLAVSVGEQVTGNRLLMIGDSLTASISERYGGQACDALVPLGWQVEVDAETGRFIDFGSRVLDKRLDAGWDAAVIFLGNNYGYDRGVFQLGLHSMLLRLAPRPTILITTTVFRPQQAEVNAAIIEEAHQFDNVSIIDWATVSEDPTLTGGDGLHLSEAGRVRMAYLLAAALGEAPVQPGECLRTSFRNDSAGSPDGPRGNSTATKPSTPSRPTSTTVKPSGSGGTNTTVKPATPSSTGSTAPSNTTRPSTSTPVTAAPSTAAPSTAAPSTAAPSTAAPSTAAPSTAAPSTAAPSTAAPSTAAPPPAGP